MPVSELLHRPAPFAQIAPQPELPLQGLTLLTVEDSRFASEALRLLCLRSGARLRRADSLEAAARHLQVYRPDAVIVDLGLPDGNGTDLIRSLSAKGTCVLGTSGDDAGHAIALAAGAGGYLAKPLPGLAGFQAAIMDALGIPLPQRASDTAETALHDRLALRDDLVHAARLLGDVPDEARRRYAAGFLASVARSANDAGLAAAARAADQTAAKVPHLQALVAARLAGVADAFAIPRPPC